VINNAPITFIPITTIIDDNTDIKTLIKVVLIPEALENV
jgi:hypothetical protein